jgi:Putative restriction endonuclease
MQTLNEVENPLKWYYELYPEEKDMAEALQHRILGNYLYELLIWYYRAEKHLILANQVVYRDRKLMVSPDVTVIKNVGLTKKQRIKFTSWKVDPPSRPAPSIAIEISSKDIEPDKLPEKYAELGVKEYFAYDPLGVWQQEVKLMGWRNQNGTMQPLDLENGRLWSDELNCWLVEDEEFLRLLDIDGNRLLTKAETDEIAREFEYRRAEQERQAKETLQIQLEQERRKAEEERQRAEARAEEERQKAEEERQRAEKLAAKLRELKIDPDTL